MIGLLAGVVPWRLVAILGLAAGVAMGAAYVTAQLKAVGRLQSQLEQATRTANENAAAVKRLKAENERIQKAAAAAAMAKAGIRTTARTRQTAIVAAPAGDDGPLAPVARAWVDGLPERPGASGAGSPAPGANRPR